MTQELVLEETRFTELTHIDEQYHWLEISNPLNLKVDVEALTDHLQHVEGINRITTLTINYNSSLTDLRVLRAFPNLKNLFVYGYQIKTFDGIEWFRNVEFIYIDTDRNRRRDISKISQTKVERIDLFVTRKEDLTAIARCRELQSIDIYRSMEPNFEEWGNMPAEKMSFKSCKFKELGNLSWLPNLKELDVLGCRSLERFKGDNSNIKRLVVETCNKLDLSTLKTFDGVEVLIVNSCTKSLNLTEIGGLNNVRSIDFLSCENVKVDLINLKEYFPNIESLYISGMKKEFGKQLKELNPDVKIKSYSFQF